LQEKVKHPRPHSYKWHSFVLLDYLNGVYYVGPYAYTHTLTLESK